MQGLASLSFLGVSRVAMSYAVQNSVVSCFVVPDNRVKWEKPNSEGRSRNGEKEECGKW